MLPDRSVLIGQKLVENVFKDSFWSNFAYCAQCFLAKINEVGGDHVDLGMLVGKTLINPNAV